MDGVFQYQYFGYFVLLQIELENGIYWQIGDMGVYLGFVVYLVVYVNFMDFLQGIDYMSFFFGGQYVIGKNGKFKCKRVQFVV